MVQQYIYFVKCPDCEDEPFDFFDDAKSYAMGCMSRKPIITQVEVCRNDFGECTDSNDLGTIWSWEDMMKDVPNDTAELSIFSKCDTLDCHDCDAEFDNLDNSLDSVPDNFRKPIPDGMSIEDLVEEMERNEDDVECTWCNELFDKSECRYEVDLGYLCSSCEAAIKSRGEPLTFRENNYWDFLDEDYDEAEAPSKADLEKAFAEDGYETMSGGYDFSTIYDNYLAINKKAPQAVSDIIDFILDEIRKHYRAEQGAGKTHEQAESTLKYLVKQKPQLRTTTPKETPVVETEPIVVPDVVELEYSDVPVIVYGAQVSGGYWDPPEYAEYETEIDYTYDADVGSVIEFLQDEITDEEICELAGLSSPNEIPWWEPDLDDAAKAACDTFWDAFWEKHLEYLVTKYEDKLLDHFKDSAFEAAQEWAAENYEA